MSLINAPAPAGFWAEVEATANRFDPSSDALQIACTGCGRVLIAAPDDEALIVMEGWCEDPEGRTWCAGCDPDDHSEPVGIPDRLPTGFQPVAVFADGSTWGYPTGAGADPWSLLNRARYGCPVCDQLIEHDDLSGGHQHAKHLAGFGLTTFGQGRRYAA